MNIAFGCDHAGFNSHKNKIVDFFKRQGHKIVDFGCFDSGSCDYPDIAQNVANAVSTGKCDKGVLICGTGIGMSIAANKIHGIRAAVCWGEEIAALAAEHNNANILCLPARFASAEEMIVWIKKWMSTSASKEERHVNRLNKIAKIENCCCKG